MSKELTPLEAIIEYINKLRNNSYMSMGDELNYEANLRRIKTALKALEIIIKKQVDVATLLNGIRQFGESLAYTQYNAIYCGEIIINREKMPYRGLTQEEFDLLKEVLK